MRCQHPDGATTRRNPLMVSIPFRIIQGLYLIAVLAVEHGKDQPIDLWPTTR